MVSEHRDRTNKRAEIKRQWLAHPKLTPSAMLTHLAARGITSTESSIGAMWSDLQACMRAGREHLRPEFAAMIRQPRRARSRPDPLFRLNQMLWADRWTDRVRTDDAIRVLLAEGFPVEQVSRNFIGGSIRASEESIALLEEAGALVEQTDFDLEILERDIAEIKADPTISETERAALVKARLGQGQFRDALRQRWQNVCAVTGCTILETLRASHIKAWHESTTAERLNPANGLLLVAHLDALFDKHLISFDDCGDMLVSSRIKDNDRRLLGIPQRLQKTLSDEERRFLAVHRANGQFSI